MTPEQLQKVAYAVHPFLYKGGLADVEADKIAERIAGIRRGLVPETEFRAMATWLGNCVGIYGIDQTPMPKITGLEIPKMGVPDFLAFIKYKDKILPVLIEVKASEEKTLVWSEKYLRSLQEFAGLLNLPLLVAWKHVLGWALVDITLFEKKEVAFHLSLETAFQEDLLSLLLGDVRYLLKDDVAFVWEATVLDCELKEEDRLIPAGEHRFRFDGAFFSIGKTKLAEFPKGLPALFFASPNDQEVIKAGGNKMRVFIRVVRDTTPTVTHVLLAELYLRSSGDTIDWDKEIMENPLPESGAYYCNVLSEGIDQGFVMYVLRQVPKTLPEFLE